MKEIFVVFCGLLFAVVMEGYTQNFQPVFVEGRVVDALNKQPVGNAQLVSYRLVEVFAADTLGYFSFETAAADSVRVTAVGYHPKNFRIRELITDSVDYILALDPKSYAIREVTVKGYRGILDPFLFPKRVDDKPKINLNLPAWIGSKSNSVPPSQRQLMSSPSALQAVSSPISFVYSKLSKRERTLRKLHKIREVRGERTIWEGVLSDSLVNQWVPVKGEKLERFILYCNANISVSRNDTRLSIRHKVMRLWKEFQPNKNE